MKDLYENGEITQLQYLSRISDWWCNFYFKNQLNKI